MSEFGLPLPPTTKLGPDGKGGKAYVVKSSSMATILGISAVLLLLSGCLFLDIRSERESFSADLGVQSKVSAQQHKAKIQAQAQLQQAAAQLSEEVGRGKEEESDLAIMLQHIMAVQHTVRVNLVNAVADAPHHLDYKKIINEQFEAMEEEVEGILHDHLVVVKNANKKSEAAIESLHEELAAELEAQEAEEE